MDAVQNELKRVVDKAALRIEIETAQNKALQKAIQIVEAFLRKTERVCYGGQAINAQLPLKDQFYNKNTSLPDYDFFSPDADADIEELIQDFNAAGYTEITKRFGIHEGTVKLYVNYVAVADITQIIPDFYEAIFKKSRSVNGIHYTDPIFLRMMMYLELSRPRGEVDRWAKVYERLVLHTKAHPLKRCNVAYTKSRAAARTRAHLMRFIIERGYALASPDIHTLYTSQMPPIARMKWLLDQGQSKSPTVFLSPDADMDGTVLAEELRAKKVPIMGYQNILPAMVALYHENDLVGLIIQQEACHSIISMNLTKQRHMYVVSLETMLTFLIGLYYRDTAILMSEDALLCLIQRYIDLSDSYKHRPTKLIPAFPIECTGYQTTFASLLRAKGARIEAARQRVSSGTRTTRRSSSRQTRRLNYLNI